MGLGLPTPFIVKKKVLESMRLEIKHAENTHVGLGDQSSILKVV